MKHLTLLFCLITSIVAAQTGEVMVSYESLDAARAAEQQRFDVRHEEIMKQSAGPQRDAQLREEVLRHQGEAKRLSMETRATRQQVVADLKQKWQKVEAGWNAEVQRHKDSLTRIESMPEGPAKQAAIQAENNAHRNTSKQLAAERHVVHEGVMKQANRDVMGGATATSNELKQTAGTKINDPNHRGMNGDFDGGGGYRTTEKAAKILDEIGVKGPPDPKTGKPTQVRVKAGVLETPGEFGMTVNAAPGTDRVGSAGHQAQVKMGAANGETYVSETGGAMRAGPLKDHVATMDHAKKAMHGLDKPPGEIVGPSSDGQAMAKGTLKAANQAKLSPEAVESIARQHGIKNPENVLDRLAEIKTGRAPIANADEAAKLQKVSRDVLRTSIAQTEKAAAAEVVNRQKNIEMLEKNGLREQSQRLRSEVADYNAKAKATSEPVRGLNEPSTGRKVISRAGFLLGAYGIYEGYQKAKEEMDAKKSAEPKGVMGWTKEKAELAAKTFWHGLGFGGMQEIGTQAGKDAFEQYKKDVEAGKVSPNDWKPYLEMKAKAVLGGLFGGAKAITYDAAKQSGTNLGNAIGEGVGAAKGLFDAIKTVRAEQKTNEERAKEIHDKLLQKGASPIGAQRAADGVLKGDFTEAKRLNKVLEGKQAAKLAAAETEQRTRSYRDRKKLAAKKEAAKQETKAREGSTVTEMNLRDTVIAKLKAKGLPANAGLVDNLVRVLERDGLPALEAAIAEMGSMQGTFSGTLAGGGSLRITVTGTKVTGSFTNAGAGGGFASAKLSGDVELTSGTISMSLKGSASADNQTVSFSATFSGSFSGNGYKGSSRGMGRTLPWTVSR
jgi:hypothetical protein